MHPIPQEIFKNFTGNSIFEIGCGQGLLFKPYYDDRTRLTPDADTLYDRTRLRVGGIDHDKVNIEAVKVNFPEYADNFILWDINNTPWPVADKSYDLVFTIGTLLMLKNPIPAITEALRIGKQVIFAEFHNPKFKKFGIEGINTSGNEALLAHHRYERDYVKVLSKFNIKPEIYKVEDKWIIKC